MEARFKQNYYTKSLIHLVYCRQLQVCLNEQFNYLKESETNKLICIQPMTRQNRWSLPIFSLYTCIKYIWYQQYVMVYSISCRGFRAPWDGYRLDNGIFQSNLIHCTVYGSNLCLKMWIDFKLFFDELNWKNILDWKNK